MTSWRRRRRRSWSPREKSRRCTSSTSCRGRSIPARHPDQYRSAVLVRWTRRSSAARGFCAKSAGGLRQPNPRPRARPGHRSGGAAVPLHQGDRQARTGRKAKSDEEQEQDTAADAEPGKKASGNAKKAQGKRAADLHLGLRRVLSLPQMNPGGLPRRLPGPLRARASTRLPSPFTASSRPTTELCKPARARRPSPFHSRSRGVLCRYPRRAGAYRALLTSERSNTHDPGKSTAVWKGDGLHGQGQPHDAEWRLPRPAILVQHPLPERGRKGRDLNPEELLGAAHAGCFAMASVALYARRRGAHRREELARHGRRRSAEGMARGASPSRTSPSISKGAFWAWTQRSSSPSPRARKKGCLPLSARRCRPRRSWRWQVERSHLSERRTLTGTTTGPEIRPAARRWRGAGPARAHPSGLPGPGRLPGDLPAAPAARGHQRARGPARSTTTSWRTGEHLEPVRRPVEPEIRRWSSACR